MQIDILDAGHGDCLLVTCDDILILIDSGPQSFKIRRSLIIELTQLLNGRPIDIGIVTHNDDDHIGGFKYLLESGIKFKQFIFNSLDLISKVIKHPPTTNKISSRQDWQLNKILEEQGIAVSTFQFEDLPLKINELLFIPLTPNNSILEKLDKKSQKKQNKIAATKSVESSIKDCFDEIETNTDIFIEDTSITNKSSISFILEHKGISSIFLGDSHPSDVIAALKSKELTNKVFHVAKLSHHASHKNTNRELIQLLGKSDYIICADKSKHGHPNNKTISRILEINQDATFHLSTNNQSLRDMFSVCTQLGYSLSVTYPENGINKVSYE